MIEYVKGDLMDVTGGIILHGCNAQGVMGSGVALAVKKRYPGAYQAYAETALYLGSTVWYDAEDTHGVPLFIANCVTQGNYGKDGKRYVNYAAIAKCFTEVFSKAWCYSYPVYFPKIGAGLGGGDWNIIEQIINDCDPEDRIKKICVIKE